MSSSMQPDQALRHARLGKARMALPAAALLVLLAACSRSAEPAEGPSATPPTAAATAPAQAAPLAAPPPAGNAGDTAPAERDIGSLTGLWRVIHVDSAGASGGPALAKDDPRIMGAVMEIAREQINWSFWPGRALPGNDICSGPRVSPVEAPDADPQLQRRIASAVLHLAPGSAAGAIHGIDCGDDGRWGPGAVGTAYLVPLGPNLVVMTWFDDSALLLQRFKNADGDALRKNQQPLRATDYEP